ncbi:hypothetical protein OG323_06200 [Streptomyces cyaneofuscatus]|uniref:hypothetical protein n=1 Tax=Streptomyces cyaneofuscatus TaxID=66883 RepID=UPI003865D3CE|nr:hypothetical protein OG323_06200 [Streptomyces cyaneofuscatus]
MQSREDQAAELAAQVVDLLNRIDQLGVGVIVPHANRITGPGFTIRPHDGRWAVTNQ